MAGDRAVGAAFLGDLAASSGASISTSRPSHDIHSIKRQIHAYRGDGAVTGPGHNVKLGRGGIREIEFFAQTQQLILGGRHPALRGRDDLRGAARARRRRPCRAPPPPTS